MKCIHMSSARFPILGMLAVALFHSGNSFAADGKAPAVAGHQQEQAQGQHAQIGVVESKQSSKHTEHPDAQWFPEAGLGLFLHWDEASVRCLETSWPMMAGTGIGRAHV